MRQYSWYGPLKESHVMIMI